MGKVGFGVVKENGIIDLTGRIHNDVSSIKDLLKLDLIEKAEEFVAEKRPEISISEITHLPVIPDPEKIFCIGLNYQEHKEETGRPDVENPTIFTRFANSQTGHLQPLLKPNFSDRFDYEGELAITIGKGGRYIPEDKAMEHIAGYSCYNDGSIRDWQRHTSQFTPGKNFPATGPFGPYLVTEDEIGDYKKLPIETRLNGKVMQKANLSDLIFPIPKLINYISSFTTLAVGDVIVTGTPGGVGDRRDPPIYMKPGDVVEVDIGKVGILMNFITED
ncbi:MAG: 5-carboxymethyl-2-hydroxymuconate isomerase [SAR116 cluster bacterium]|nr:5-carboxymethyl-2-hydroxymuconate isomerase [SAR116 cluster bacterium]